MTNSQFKKFISEIKRGGIPVICGHSLNKYQFAIIKKELKKHINKHGTENHNNYIELLQVRVT